MNAEQEIKRLKRLLQREKRKNKRLRDKLYRENETDLVLHEDIPTEFLRRAQEARLLRKKSYLSYLTAMVRQNSLYQIWKKYVGYFRRLSLVSATLQLIGYFFLVVQTGTVFFVAITLLLITLPVLVSIAIGVYGFSLLLVPHDNKALSCLMAGKTVYVMFLTKTEEFSRGNFWKENAFALAAQSNTVVLLVSPYFLSGKGLTDNRQFYWNVRQERPNTCLIRKHYYFSLRYHLVTRSERTVLIY